MIRSQVQQLRDVEQARIARWFGTGEHGRVYIGPRGRAFPVTDVEHVRWRAQASGILERYLKACDECVGMIFAIGVFLAGAGYLAGVWFGDVVPLLGRVEPALAALPALAWPLVVEIRFRAALAGLRRRVADRLSVRSAVPEAIAAAGRRYNIFQLAMWILVLGILADIGVIAWHGRAFDGVYTVIAVVIVPLHALQWASRRVDAARRRA